MGFIQDSYKKVQASNSASNSVRSKPNNAHVDMFSTPKQNRANNYREFANGGYGGDFPKPWGNAPDVPNMTQYVNPKTGKMRSQFRVGENDNLWLQMRNDKIDKELSQNRDVASSDAQNQYQSGVNRLGMTGGVDAGSRARLAQQSQRSQLGNMQSAANTAGMSRSNAAMQHAGMLQDSDRINVGNALGALGRQDQWNQDIYNNTMGWQAAERMANAYGGGGGGGGEDNLLPNGYAQGVSNNIHVATGQRSPSPSPYSGSGEESRGDIIYDKNGIRIRRGDLIMSTPSVGSGNSKKNTIFDPQTYGSW